MGLGVAHACAVSVAGSVRCWGLNDGGQTTVPPAALADQVAVLCAYHYSCSLSRLGAVTCWGSMSYPPAPAMAHSQVALAASQEDAGMGADTLCSVSWSGALTCIGYNAHGQAQSPAQAANGQLDVHGWYQNICSLSASGGLLCWGEGHTGINIVPMGIAADVALPCTSPALIFLRSLSPTSSPMPSSTASSTASSSVTSSATSTSSVSPSLTPGLACPVSLFRSLPRTDRGW